jgi:hypothetical protein
MAADALRIVQITGKNGEVLEREWLAGAEAVHRQLRPQLPADYFPKMQRIFRDGGEMCVAVSTASSKIRMPAAGSTSMIW